MYTFSGTAFSLFDPQPEQVCILDIAHGLSKNVRFNGQICANYMIAEHSLLMSYFVPGSEFHGLMHDDAEAYIGDMIRPMKYLDQMHPYREIEHAIESVISEKYGFPVEKTQELKDYDRFMSGVEAMKFFLKPPDWALKRLEEFPTLIKPSMKSVLRPAEAELLWLRRFMQLTNKTMEEIIDEAVFCNKGIINNQRFMNYYRQLYADYNLNLESYREIQFGETNEARKTQGQ